MRLCVCALSLILITSLYGCSASPPQNPQNLCEVFQEKSRWYKYAKSASERWGASIPVSMAIMYQESGFAQFAKPPRKKLLWIIPGPRASDAFGYAQALNSTWEWYLKESGREVASRNSFADAVDFIGWYNHKSGTLVKISNHDAYNLYLAYHEGQGGYKRGSYRKKQWLIAVARKVATRAANYQRQLEQCSKQLEQPWIVNFFRSFTGKSEEP